jgi:two-component system, LytTR family, response regulator AlgR
MLTQAPLRVLVVDDEPLARARLRALLEGCRDPHAELVAEAGTATQAQAWLREHGCDLVLLDVQMPGPDGLSLAQSLRQLPRPPLVVFVTAYSKHAVDAFELEALDFLTKPVRQERLQAALVRVAQRLKERGAVIEPTAATDDAEVIPINDRGRIVRVPLAEVLYLKAELKYLTVRTITQRYVMEGSLGDWEQRLAGRFLRIHRNALVAKAAIRELDRHVGEPGESASMPLEPGEGGDAQESWAVRVAPVNEWLAVSRRQLAAVREALRSQA